MDALARVLTAPPLPPGTRVEVRSRYRRGWSRGFEIAGHGDGGYRLRRASDRSVLPVEFPADQVREAAHLPPGVLLSK